MRKDEEPTLKNVKVMNPGYVHPVSFRPCDNSFMVTKVGRGSI